MTNKTPRMEDLHSAASAAQQMYAALAPSYALPDAGWTVCIQEPFLDEDGGDFGVVVFITTVDTKSPPSAETPVHPSQIIYPIRSIPERLSKEETR